MPVYYSPQDPARYYQGEQSRRDQNFQNMLRMMMQLQAFKQRQQEFNIKQKSAQDAQEWRETFQQNQMNYRDFLSNPEAQAAMAGLKERARQKERPEKITKPPVTLPDNIIRWITEKTGWTEDAVKAQPDAAKLRWMGIWERYNKPKTQTENKPGTTTTSFFANIRRRARSAATKYGQKAGAVYDFIPESVSELNAITRSKTQKDIPIEAAVAEIIDSKLTDFENASIDRKLTSDEKKRLQRMNSILGNIGDFQKKYKNYFDAIIRAEATMPEEERSSNQEIASFILSEIIK